MLKDSLSLLDTSIPAHEQLVRVARGVYALLLYAIDFWAEHLISSATRQHLERNSHIALALLSFNLLHEQCFQKDDRATDKLFTNQGNDARIASISHLPGMSVCADYLAFQQYCKSQAVETGKGEFSSRGHYNYKCTSLEVVPLKQC